MNRNALKWIINNPEYEYNLYNDDEIEKYAQEHL